MSVGPSKGWMAMGTKRLLEPRAHLKGGSGVQGRHSTLEGCIPVVSCSLQAAVSVWRTMPTCTSRLEHD